MKRFAVADEVLITCYEDLRKLEGFVTDVSEHSLKEIRILASYDMPKEIKCGILQCHQPHKEGCAIKRSDGLITNIGHCCAGRLLGDEWLYLKREYRDRFTREGKKRIINKFLDEPRVYIRQAFTLWYDGGAGWLDAAQTNFLAGAPQTLREALLRRARSGITQVVETRERRAEDWAAHLGFSSQDNDSSMISIPVGNLAGLNCLRNCPYDSVYRNLILRVQHWLQVDPGAMDDSCIKECVQELRSFPQRLNRIAAMVADGRAFFTPENFALFAPLLDQDCRAGASNALKHYEWDFKLCRWVVSPKLGLTRQPGRAA